MTLEDTSIILSKHIPGCKSLENITKHNSIWMGADADWTSLMLNLGKYRQKIIEFQCNYKRCNFPPLTDREQISGNWHFSNRAKLATCMYKEGDPRWSNRTPYFSPDQYVSTQSFIVLVYNFANLLILYDC